MRLGFLFRLVVLPEFGRSLAGSRGSLRRIRLLFQEAKPKKGRVSTANLLLPAGRATALLGAALVMGGVVLLVYGVAGLEKALAQTIDPGLFAAEDQETRKVLEFLSGLDKDNTAVLGEMFRLFNSGVLVLVGFLLIWHTVTGSVATAREGRWGFGAWEVLRIVLAVALMWPLSSGLSAAQYAVIGLAKLGGDFANAVWEPVAVKTLGKGRSLVPWPREREWRTLIGRTLVAEVCRHVANEDARGAGDDPYVALRWVDDMSEGSRRVMVRNQARVTGRKVGESLHYDGAGSGLPKDMCGAVRFKGLTEEGARGIAARGHLSAWRAVHGEILGVAKKVGDHFVPGTATYGDPPPDIAALLDGAGVAATYRAVLELAMKEAGNKGQEELEEKIGEDAARLGWIGAASFVNSLSRSAGRIQSAASNIPEASVFSAELEKVSEKAWSAVLATVTGLAQAGGYQPVPVALATGLSGARASSDGRGGTMLDRMVRFIDPESLMVADSGNPLLDLAGMGFSLIDAGMAALGVFAGVAVGNNLLESIPLFGGGLDAFEASWQVMDGIVTPVIAMLLIGGAVLAYVLPAIPFIRFLFGILGWMLMVLEGVLAVTVFCAAHVTRGEGDRLMLEGTKQGWLFFPALILRPVLMLFGLVLGFFLFVTVMGLFNDTWLKRMRDVSGSSGLGMIEFLAMLVLYVMVAYGVINACFKAIDLLPNVVLEWIGGGSRGAGEAEGVGQTATGGFGRMGALRGFGSLRRGGGGAAPSGG